MKMTADGFDQVMAQLRNAATKVPDNARKVMHRQADKIVELAKLMAPHDTGELEDAIHKEISYEGRGRLVIDIVCGGTIRGVDVDRYAAEIHENYESMKPGVGTIAKRAANPGIYVGGKFLERALNESLPKLNKALIEGTMADIER
jgi:hypothetical protein